MSQWILKCINKAADSVEVGYCGDERPDGAEEFHRKIITVPGQGEYWSSKSFVQNFLSRFSEPQLFSLSNFSSQEVFFPTPCKSNLLATLSNGVLFQQIVHNNS